MADTDASLCPFSRLPCLGAKCVLTVRVQTDRQGQIPELAHREAAVMCAFLASLRALTVIANRPPVVVNPSRTSPSIGRG